MRRDDNERGPRTRSGRSFDAMARRKIKESNARHRKTKNTKRPSSLAGPGAVATLGLFRRRHRHRRRRGGDRVAVHSSTADRGRWWREEIGVRSLSLDSALAVYVAVAFGAYAVRGHCRHLVRARVRTRAIDQRHRTELSNETLSLSPTPLPRATNAALRTRRW